MRWYDEDKNFITGGVILADFAAKNVFVNFSFFYVFIQTFCIFVSFIYYSSSA